MKEQHKLLCLEVLDFMQENHEDKTKFFNGPAEDALDPEMKATYRSMIERPQDFAQIRKKLESNSYLSIAAFKEDANLCFDNCKIFCKKYYPEISTIAQNLQKVFRNQMEKIEKKIRILPTECNIAGPPLKSSTGDISSNKPSAAPASIPRIKSDSKLSVKPSQSTSSSKFGVDNQPKKTTSLPGFRPKCERILRAVNTGTSITKLLQVYSRTNCSYILLSINY